MTDRDKLMTWYDPPTPTPTAAEITPLVEVMAAAYAAATGVTWTRLHVNHRAGLIAALNAALQTMGRATTCPHRVGVLWTGAHWVHVVSGELATCDRMVAP